MEHAISNILSAEDVTYLTHLPEVLTARNKLQESGTVYFSIPLTDSIRSVLATRFGIDVSHITEIPMRWIQGDTHPHIDVGRNKFENTYLIYLNDSPGEFLLGDVSHPITANTGYVFHEGISHSTQNTGISPRLILGPMNEFAQPVGASVTFYYPSEADAIANTNLIIAYGSYVINAVSGFTHWRLASTSTGPSPQNVIYTVGDTLTGNNTTDFYYLYPTAPCFLEGTNVLCQVDRQDVYVPIEKLRRGMFVKTSRDGYKQVALIGNGVIQNPGTYERTENRLYKCSPSNYPELKEDVFITGCHSILVPDLTDAQREATKKHLRKIYVTDCMYRLMACIDERAEPWNSEGRYTIWHIALENTDESMNYGVYVNGGLLVETCSIRTLKSKSNMTLL
jgi:hypothetical protein